MPQNKNPFTPDLGRADTPTYVRPGIQPVNKAGIIAGSVASLVPGAMEMYEGYKTKQEVIDPMDEAIMTYEEAQGTAEAIGYQAEQIDKTWEQLGQVPEKTSDIPTLGKEAEKIDLLEKSIADNTKKYIKAKEQGLLTESELLARITKITREAVSRNPWMEDRYYNAAQKYLKQSGIGDVLDMRMKAAKDKADSAQKYMESLRQEMKEKNIKYDPSMSVEYMQAAVNKKRHEAAQLQNLRDIQEGKIIIDKLQIREKLTSGGAYVGHQLDIEQLQNDARGMYLNAGNDANAIANVGHNLVTMHQTKMNQWRRVLGTEASTEDGKAFLEAVDNDYKNMLDSLKGVATGKEAATIIENHLNALKNSQEMNLHLMFDVPAMNMATKIYQTLYPDGMKAISLKEVAGHPVNRLLSNAKAMLEAAATVSSPEDAGRQLLQRGAKNGAFVTLFDSVAKTTDGKYGLDTKQALGRAMFTFNQSIRSGLSEEESYPFAYDIMAKAAANADTIRQRGVSPEYTRQTNQMISFAMGKIAPDLAHITNRIMQETNVMVDFKVLPNGTFVIQTGDMELDNKFAEKFGKNINNAIDTYASAMGQTREKAAEEFYGKFLGGFLYDEPIMKKSSDTSVTPPGEFKIDSGKKAKTPEGGPDFAKITEEYRAGQAARNTAQEEIIAKEKEDLRKQLVADEAALRIAKQNRPDDAKYLKFLEDRIEAAKGALSGKGKEFR